MGNQEDLRARYEQQMARDYPDRVRRRRDGESAEDYLLAVDPEEEVRRAAGELGWLTEGKEAHARADGISGEVQAAIWGDPDDEDEGLASDAQAEWEATVEQLEDGFSTIVVAHGQRLAHLAREDDPRIEVCDCGWEDEVLEKHYRYKAAPEA